MSKQTRRLHKTASGDGSREIPAAAGPDHANIARLAYLYWLERGCPVGSPEQDWFQAEQDLKNGQTRAAQLPPISRALLRVRRRGEMRWEGRCK
jgi:hypothetical protein